MSFPFVRKASIPDTAEDAFYDRVFAKDFERGDSRTVSRQLCCDVVANKIRVCRSGQMVSVIMGAHKWGICMLEAAMREEHQPDIDVQLLLYMEGVDRWLKPENEPFTIDRNGKSSASVSKDNKPTIKKGCACLFYSEAKSRMDTRHGKDAVSVEELPAEDESKSGSIQGAADKRGRGENASFQAPSVKRRSLRGVESALPYSNSLPPTKRLDALWRHFQSYPLSVLPRLEQYEIPVCAPQCREKCVPGNIVSASPYSLSCVRVDILARTAFDRMLDTIMALDASLPVGSVTKCKLKMQNVGCGTAHVAWLPTQDSPLEELRMLGDKFVTNWPNVVIRVPRSDYKAYDNREKSDSVVELASSCEAAFYRIGPPVIAGVVVKGRGTSVDRMILVLPVLSGTVEKRLGSKSLLSGSVSSEFVSEYIARLSFVIFAISFLNILCFDCSCNNFMDQLSEEANGTRSIIGVYAIDFDPQFYVKIASSCFAVSDWRSIYLFNALAVSCHVKRHCSQAVFNEWRCRFTSITDALYSVDFGRSSFLCCMNWNSEDGIQKYIRMRTATKTSIALNAEEIMYYYAIQCMKKVGREYVGSLVKLVEICDWSDDPKVVEACRLKMQSLFDSDWNRYICRCYPTWMFFSCSLEAGRQGLIRAMDEYVKCSWTNMEARFEKKAPVFLRLEEQVRLIRARPDCAAERILGFAD